MIFPVQESPTLPLKGVSNWNDNNNTAGKKEIVDAWRQCSGRPSPHETTFLARANRKSAIISIETRLCPRTATDCLLGKCRNLLVNVLVAHLDLAVARRLLDQNRPLCSARRVLQQGSKIQPAQNSKMGGDLNYVTVSCPPHRPHDQKRLHLDTHRIVHLDHSSVNNTSTCTSMARSIKTACGNAVACAAERSASTTNAMDRRPKLRSATSKQPHLPQVDENKQREVRSSACFPRWSLHGQRKVSSGATSVITALGKTAFGQNRFWPKNQHLANCFL